MIRSRPGSNRSVRSRVRIGGLYRRWEAVPPTPHSLPIAIWRSGSPRTLRIETPQLDQPILGDSAGIEMGEARTLPIGWFDTERFQEGLNGAGEGGSEGGDGAVPASRLSPEEELARRLAAILQPPLSALTAPQGVLEWPAPLLPYQQEGVAALLSRRDLLLADDMGLGKTITAIVALRILLFQERITSALIVCPASLLPQWRRELERWGPDLRVVTVAGRPDDRAGLWRLPAHVKLVGYETLRMDVLDLAESPVTRVPWDLVILDEAARIKNRESGVAIACRRLPRLRRWALTGTPLENRIEDVVALLEFLTGEPNQRFVAPVTHAALRDALHEHQLRRRKSDVLKDLPPKQVVDLPVELLPRQRAAYDEAEREGIVHLTRTGASITVTHVLELISRLKQLCNFDPVSGESVKLQDIAARLRTLTEEGHRALVFSQFIDGVFGIARAAEYLKAFRPMQYTGSLSVGQKNSVVERFMGDPTHKVLLLSLRAGAVGLNLQAASYVFHLDRWWNPAIEEQAESRAHRMGQPYPVTVFRYTCLSTIEERIEQTLREKRRLFHEIVDDVSIDLASTLSEEELFGLFDLTSSRQRGR